MDAKDRYKCHSDRELLMLIAERTEDYPQTRDDVRELKRDRWWVFTLIGAGWMAIIGLFKVHG